MLCSTYHLFGALACTLLAVYVHATPVSWEEKAIREAYHALKMTRGLSERDVVAPPIIKPDATSVWPIGTVQEVTWDTSKLPPDNQITNPRGRILLGRDTGDSLNLDIDHPLAEGFHIRQGRINITVPNVTPRPDYLIVLMGNSGNTSPSFAITQIAGGGGTTSPLPPPVIDPTPSLPGIVPTRSTRPAPVSPTATSIAPTSLISTPVSVVVPTSAASEATTSVEGSTSAASNPVSSTRSISSSASQPVPSDLNQEEDGSAAIRSSFNVAATALGASFIGLLVTF
ncbi:hypothetical protein BKA70DRAFT_312961 [Coprinopsis sp. MPI-PUGE-AT-0042]|nr:hypothetical protein BKA70DRAFT_312961 [Coprinopsis sp. MPI-PUGE-AT-0042]